MFLWVSVKLTSVPLRAFCRGLAEICDGIFGVATREGFCCVWSRWLLGLFCRPAGLIFGIRCFGINGYAIVSVDHKGNEMEKLSGWSGGLNWYTQIIVRGCSEERKALSDNRKSTARVQLHCCWGTEGGNHAELTWFRSLTCFGCGCPALCRSVYFCRGRSPLFNGVYLCLIGVASAREIPCPMEWVTLLFSAGIRGF